MTFSPYSSAPHLHPARDWRLHTHDLSRLILFKSNDSPVEVGIRRFVPGITPLGIPNDHVAYIFLGSGQFQPEQGEVIDASPGAFIHFKAGWQGSVRTAEPIEISYMSCEGASSDQVPVLRDALHAGPLKDWGIIPTMIEGASRTGGILLSRDSDMRAESGVWACTPGHWRCEVTSDEYCHFLDGSCTYTHDNGDIIEIHPDTLAFFPRGWAGRCRVLSTVRKVYLIR